MIDIGAGAFEDTPLTTMSIGLPAALERIHDRAFKNTKISYVDFPSFEMLQHIGASAFEGTKLSSVSLYPTVLSVGDRAFAASSLTRVNIDTPSATYGDHVFGEETGPDWVVLTTLPASMHGATFGPDTTVIRLRHTMKSVIGDVSVWQAAPGGIEYPVQWLSEVTFNLHGGWDAAAGQLIGETLFYPAGTELTYPMAVPTKEGYGFQYFALDAAGTQPITFPFTMPDGVVTIHAIWDEPNYWLLYYDTQTSGFTSEMFPLGKPIEAPNITMTGFTLEKWIRYASGPDFTFPFTPMAAGYTPLLPIFTINKYTVTFDPLNGSNVITRTPTYDNWVYSVAAPTRTNHVFGGWARVGEDTRTSFPFRQPDSDLAFEALWTRIDRTVSSPADAKPGEHEIVIRYGSGEEVRTPFTVRAPPAAPKPAVPPKSPSGRLANTGYE